MQNMLIANPAAAFGQGAQVGNALVDARQQRTDQNNLRNLLSTGDINDPAVQRQVMGINPQMGMQLENRTYQRGRDALSDRMATERHSANMQLTEARLAQIYADSKQNATEQVRALSAEQAAAEQAQLDGLLASASAAYQGGQRALSGWVQQNAQALTESGMDPAKITYEMFPALMAGMVGTREGLSAGVEFADGLRPEQAKPDYKILDGQFVDQNNPAAGAQPIPGLRPEQPQDPVAIQALRIRAQEAGLTPGTPKYQEFMRTGGRSSNGFMLEQTEDGFTLTQGPIGQQAPIAQAPAPAQAPVPEQQVGNEAFGVGGFVKGAANAVSDGVAGVEVFPEAGQQARLFADLETDLLQGIAQSFDRQPAARYMDIIRDTLPQAGNPFKGPAGARNRLAQLKQRFETDIAVLQEQSRGTNRRDKQDLRNQALALQKLVRRIERAQTSIAEPDTQLQGISPDVADRLSAYD